LGGSRVATSRRLYFNLWFVFLVSGFWHGASWNFVIYGAFHGTFMVLERLFLLKYLEKIGKIPSIIFTFFVIVLARVFFRVETFSDAMMYFQRLFAFDFQNFIWETKLHFLLIMLLAAFISYIPATKIGMKAETLIYKANLSTREYFVYCFIALVFLIYSTASLAGSGFSPFIYFRF
jgi:alginate O-acetyltransferase complex protein AlgI